MPDVGPAKLAGAALFEALATFSWNAGLRRKALQSGMILYVINCDL
jgi:hypothetical protein